MSKNIPIIQVNDTQNIFPIQRTRINLKSDLKSDRQNSIPTKRSRENSPLINLDKHNKTSDLDMTKIRKNMFNNHGHTISSQSNISGLTNIGGSASSHIPPPNSNTVKLVLLLN